jgi:hypothetical protein
MQLFICSAVQQFYNSEYATMPTIPARSICSLMAFLAQLFNC